MNTINNIYLSGLGAIGSTYASLLYNMDPDCIKVIADSERIDKYSKKGVTVNNISYSFNYITPEDSEVPADLIMIAVKQHHLEQSIKDIRKFVGRDTIILSLLNGISSEEIIGAEFGMDKVLYGFCVGVDAIREGTKTNYASRGRIVFGDKVNDVISPKAAVVKELFERAGIPYLIPVDMIREQWWKFMLNVGINQASAILRAPYGVFHKVTEAAELMKLASQEVISLAKVLNINLSEKDLNNYMEIIKTLVPDGKTSMLQDIEAGRKTEVEIFGGKVIELGQKYNVKTPVNEMFFKIIRALENMQTL